MIALLLVIFVTIAGTRNPGIKFDYPEATLTYMVNQVFPWVQKQLKDIHMEDIHQKVSTPVGKVSFDITNAVISEIAISSPSFKIVNDHQIMIIIEDLFVKGSASWAYKQSSFPHLKDHGSFDMSDLDVSISVNFGATIDESHSSHLRIDSDSFNLNWKKFDIKVHGGASWLYNFLISTFKSPIENTITKILQNSIPSAVVGLLQPMVDAMVYEYPVGIGDISFSYLMESIAFSPNQNFMSFGVDGFFKQKGQVPPGDAEVMPDIYGSQMIQIFLSQYSFFSSLWAGTAAGLMKYVIKDDPSLPVHLNTDSLGIFVPELKQKYPGQQMQCTVQIDPDNIPYPIFNTSENLIQGNFDAVFQVINDTIIDVFTLDVSSKFNVSIMIKEGEHPYEYTISAEIALKEFNLKVKKSDVGTFDPSPLQEMIKAFIEFFVLPNLNKYYLKGIPLPSSPNFVPKNPTLKSFDGYILAALDFDFYPPN